MIIDVVLLACGEWEPYEAGGKKLECYGLIQSTAKSYANALSHLRFMPQAIRYSVRQASVRHGTYVKQKAQNPTSHAVSHYTFLIATRVPLEQI